MIKVGFLGTGNMGGAIIRGIISCYGNDAEVYAYDPDREKLSQLEKDGIKPVSSEGELCEVCKYVFLAIKPQVFESVLPKLAPYVKEDTVFVSIAAGITEEYIAGICGEKVRTVIVMPNTPFLLGKGATALAKGKYTTDEEFAVVMDIFRTGGIAEVVPMDKMKEIIAVNGSSPAFIYLFAKGFADYAKSVGIDAETALRLFAQSLIGSAEMLTNSGKSIDELIKMVSSPGGTTLAGLDGLYEGRLTDVVADCCERCTKRAYELSK
ncbi:MAG: pyrroline-5-carboxylate reductase [Oscillospiraceae bacterium]|nr:pyrroline-5-carboxylate reductase [Oscillospiraceae bacterium]